MRIGFCLKVISPYAGLNTHPYRFPIVAQFQIPYSRTCFISDSRKRERLFMEGGVVAVKAISPGGCQDITARQLQKREHTSLAWKLSYGMQVSNIGKILLGWCEAV